jgi:hypothetical protein
MLHKDYVCKGSVAKKKKKLVLSLKGFGAKTIGGKLPVVK